MANRKAAEAYIYQFLKDVEPTGYNVEKYKELFANMTDKAFHAFMTGLRDGSRFLVIFKPMYKATGITVENNLKIAPKYGVKFFQKLTYQKTNKRPSFTTAVDYMVLDLPYRRQSQTLDKKISVPDDNKSIDESTFQPTGESKGAKISYPELQVLIGMGLDKTISELIQYRGGDRNGFNAYNAMFMKYGSVNLKTLSNYSSGTESTKTLKTYLTAAHIRNNI